MDKDTSAQESLWTYKYTCTVEYCIIRPFSVPILPDFVHIAYAHLAVVYPVCIVVIIVAHVCVVDYDNYFSYSQYNNYTVHSTMISCSASCVHFMA